MVRLYTILFTCFFCSYLKAELGSIVLTKEQFSKIDSLKLPFCEGIIPVDSIEIQGLSTDVTKEIMFLMKELTNIHQGDEYISNLSGKLASKILLEYDQEIPSYIEQFKLKPNNYLKDNFKLFFQEQLYNFYKSNETQIASPAEIESMKPNQIASLLIQKKSPQKFTNQMYFVLRNSNYPLLIKKDNKEQTLKGQ